MKSLQFLLLGLVVAIALVRAQDEDAEAAPACLPVMCRMYCQYGWQKDDAGCEVCACNEPCDICEDTEECVLDSSNQATCIPPEPVKIGVNMEPMVGAGLRNHGSGGGRGCPMLDCSSNLECVHGYLTDENGCATCDCKDSPCQGFECESGKVCRPHEVQCFESPCPMMPTCVLQPLCFRQHEDIMHSSMSENRADPSPLLGADVWSRPPTESGNPPLLGSDPPRLGADDWSRPPAGGSRRGGSPLLGAGRHGLPPVDQTSDGQHIPQCTEEGDFLPRQCSQATNECWCVDDRGVEIEGSRKNVITATSPPICAFNRTSELHGHFKMSHSIDNIDNHLDNIREITHQHLSEWLVVEQELIVEIVITPCGEDIHMLEVDFLVRANDESDLATSSFHLQEQARVNSLAIEYQGHTLQPDQHSFNVDHTFSPTLPTVGLRSQTTESFYKGHQAAIFAGLIGFGFCLLVLLVLLKMVAARRRLTLEVVKQPGQNLKENLAFANQLYGKLGDDEKKGPLNELEVTPGDESLA